MIRKSKRCIALLLIAVLLLGMIPTAYATETDSTASEEAASEVTEASFDPTEPTEPTESTEAVETTEPTETTEVTEPVEPAKSLQEVVSAEEVPDEDYGIMPFASTTSNVLLFDQASPNYTTVLSSQVSVTYRPNGTGSAVSTYVKNLGWHFARINGVAYPDDPIYCIEPHKNYAASTSGNYVDTGITVDGSGGSRGANVWYALPAERREAIALTLLFSRQRWNDSYSVTNTPMASNPNVPLRVATQFLIYEIAMGLRDAGTFTLNDSNGYTDGDVLYNAGVANVSGFASHYNSIVASVQAAQKIPSFTSRSSGSAPTITLKGKETSVTDTNDVLSNFTFTDGNGAEFYKSGNTLYITQTGTIPESTVFRATRYLPSAGDSSFSIYYGATSTYQVCVKLYTPSSGNLNAYFKLKAVPQVGNISLTKTTEDGKNLSGWRFGIYSNSACTSLVSGPHTSNSSGKISVTGLSAGTYYVKELGHTDSSINALYTCSSTNPQRITLTAGQTASVSFQNKLNTGSIKIVKVMPDGGSTAGWKFEVRSADNKLVGTYTTADDGTILAGSLLPGEYTVKEIIPEGSPYVCDLPNPKTVTIQAGQTAEVIFTNRLKPGEISVQKVDTLGRPLAGAEFLLEWSADGNQWAPVTFTDSLDVKEGTCTSEKLKDGKILSGSDGMVRFTGLHSGSLYRVTETKAPNGYQLLTKPVHEGSIQVGKEYFVQLTVVNAPVFELPMTGSTGSRWQTGLQLVGASALLGLLLYIAFKKRR